MRIFVCDCGRNNNLFLYDAKCVSGESGKRLFLALESCGYVSLLNSFDCRRYPQHLIQACSEMFDPGLRATCELLCLGKTVELSRLPKDVAEAVSELAGSGLARITERSISTAPLVLYVIEGLLYFAEMPSPLITIYFGEDSIALASRLNLLVQDRGRVLDVCSGPGIQGILAASVGYDVTAVEINPIAASVAMCNAALNGCAENYRVCCQSFDSFAQAGHKPRFDKIFANPPLVPVPDEYAYQFIGDGGVDGLSLTSSIVKQAPAMLNPGGEFIVIGASGGDESGPFLLDVVDEALSSGSYNASLSLLKSYDVLVGSPWVSRMAETLAGYSMKRGAPSIRDISESYRKSGVSSIYFFTLSVSVPVEGPDVSSNGSFRVLDFTRPNVGGEMWWVL